jgi:eukaryotic-like serine/threonine-protein kinase
MMLKRLYRTVVSICTSKPFIIFVGGFAALFLLLNYVVLPWYVYHGGTLTVPDLTGSTYEAAKDRLSEMGLVAIEGDRVLDNAHPVGTIITQNPKPNAVVKYGRHVYLTICGGEVLVPVPSLRGRSLRDARFALERNGLMLGETSYAPSDSSPVNTIISQSVAINERVKKGTTIAVTVSSGSLTRTIQVPDLTGKSLVEAQKLIEHSHLTLGNVTFQVNAELLPNTVVEQIPSAGTAVDSGMVVDLFVVKAGKLIDER